MRTTVTIDDALYERALQVSDCTMDKTELFREAIKLFMRVNAARRLAELGGSDPGAVAPPRRKGEPGP